jgi:UDP-N-acetylglucosamine--N-acetylmuramyl-(pentapeptide) pyrophosphoryl-undecaprenol N-acetylglucosamine transferase
MKTALIVAGGTGGHIFPGLAVARALQHKGWSVQWAGGRGAVGSPSMESKLIPGYGFAFNAIDFSGVRGKGLLSLLRLPVNMARACWQSATVLRKVRPSVVLVFGGYISFPMGIMAKLLGQKLLVHEQNSVAGMANRLLAKVADQVATAFPQVLKNARWVGNPLRSEFLSQAAPDVRAEQRRGPLRLLVVGGSLGAKALNDILPLALASIPLNQRPAVTHQSGQAHIEALQKNYAQAGVEATVLPFIDDMATAMSNADLIVCRSGASTVTEVAAIGAAAAFVPFPFAVDDHQTSNAKYLSDCGAAWLLPQAQLTVDILSNMLQNTERSETISRGHMAKKMQKPNATEELVQMCEELTI